MKIAVISDTHIPDRYDRIPESLCEELKKVDMIIHAGDLVHLDLLEKLKSFCPNVKAVIGNMDPPEVRRELPEKEIITVGEHKIGIMHGWGAPHRLIETLKEAFKKDNVEVIIFGHSHNSVNEERDGILFFNPGSVTDKIFAKVNSYGIIEINDEIKARIIKL